MAKVDAHWHIQQVTNPDLHFKWALTVRIKTDQAVIVTGRPLSVVLVQAVGLAETSCFRAVQVSDVVVDLVFDRTWFDKSKVSLRDFLKVARKEPRIKSITGGWLERKVVALGGC